MGFLKSLFSGKEQTPEEKQKEEEAKNFDIFKYDGIRAARMGKFDYAIKCFREALKIRDDSETRSHLWQALVNTEDFDGAIDELRTLHGATPDDLSILLNIAMVAYMKEDYNTMEEACEEAMETDSANPQVYYRSAQARMGKGNIDEGVELLSKALSLQPSFAAALLLRGRTMLTKGDVKGAIGDAEKMLEENPADEDALMLKAEAQQTGGDKAAAIATYGEVIAVNPFNADAFRERASLRQEEGDEKGAEEDRRTLAELRPEEAADVSSEHSTEGVEYKVRKVLRDTNPLGI